MSEISEFAEREEENHFLVSDQEGQQKQRSRGLSQINRELDNSSDQESAGELDYDAHVLGSVKARGPTLGSKEDGHDRSWRELTRDASSGGLGFGTQEVFQEIYSRAGRRMLVGDHGDEEALNGGVALCRTLHNRIPGDVVSEGSWSLSSVQSQEEVHPDFVAPPSSQPRPQSEADERDMDEQSDIDGLSPMVEEQLAIISDVLEEFDFPEAREDVAWTFAQAPPEEIENLRRISLGLPPKELEEEQFREQLDMENLDLYKAFDFTGKSIEDGLSDLENAPMEEIENLRKALTNLPLRESPDRTQPSIFESVDEFVQQHPYFLQADAASSERLRVNFEKAVYKFARRLGMGSNRAKVEVWKARAAFMRNVGLGNGTMWVVDDSDEEALDVPPMPIILRRAVDVYPSYDPETSHSNMAQVAANPNQNSKGKRKMVDMAEKERNEAIAKRQKKAGKKARKLAIAEAKQSKYVHHSVTLSHRVSGEAENSNSYPEVNRSPLQKTVVESPLRVDTVGTAAPESHSLPPAPASTVTVREWGPRPPGMNKAAWKKYKKDQKALEQPSNTGDVDHNVLLQKEVLEAVAKPPSQQKINKLKSKTEHKRKLEQPKQSFQATGLAPVLHAVMVANPKTGNQPVTELDKFNPGVADTATNSAKQQKRKRNKKRNQNRLPKSELCLKRDGSPLNAGKVDNSLSIPQAPTQGRSQGTASNEYHSKTTRSSSIELQDSLDVLASPRTTSKSGTTLAEEDNSAADQVPGALSELRDGNSTMPKPARRDRGRKISTRKSLELGGQSLEQSGKVFRS